MNIDILSATFPLKYKINIPGYKGYQLPCITPINFSNVIEMTKAALHLKKPPRLTEKIKHKFKVKDIFYIIIILNILSLNYLF